MSVTPRLVPDHECKQGKCGAPTTGCWGECNMKRYPAYFVAADTISVAATLPAAPAPSRATAEQTAEINAAVKAGRIVFDPGWNDPRPSPAPTGKAALQALVDQAQELNMGYGAAPTEQAGEAAWPKPGTVREILEWIVGMTDDVAISKMATAGLEAHAALAARQAPTEQEIIGAFAIKVEKWLCTALGREWSVSGISIDSLISELAARPAPARNAILDQAIAVVPGGSICDPQQVADAIQALKGPEQ
jgi:hypothetical protein